MQQVKIYTASPSDLSPPVQSESFCVDLVLASDYRELEQKCAALAAENAYLLNGAARELNTSWMFHKTMLGAQAALVFLSHGYQAAAREWLEGTTDEAGAEIPDDISVGELHEWFDRQMVSNDGKSGFLTRSEAEEAIRKACPATDALLAEVRAQAHKEGAYFVANRMLAAWDAGFIDDTAKNAADIARMILTSTEFMADAPEGDFDRSFADGVLEGIAAQLRKGVQS
ncbi:hypothetical protein NZC95_001779 [Salmonella enterica]|nr:hypothetical protein [Salmonella enterica subsp. enterica serovar Muenchen]EDQ3992831.1 hypothetical protein [Salmonella enterica subsp. enterica]EJP8988782.1 hypothetical protein [Salmonella enterica]EKZ1885881.1 hypothetical protein [Salmonella enterica]